MVGDGPGGRLVHDDNCTSCLWEGCRKRFKRGSRITRHEKAHEKAHKKALLRPYPAGVYKKGKRFQAKCKRNHRNIYLGTFDTAAEAGAAYTTFIANNLPSAAASTTADGDGDSDNDGGSAYGSDYGGSGFGGSGFGGSGFGGGKGFGGPQMGFGGLQMGMGFKGMQPDMGMQPQMGM